MGAEAAKDKDHAEEGLSLEDVKMTLKNAMNTVFEDDGSGASIEYDHDKTAMWSQRISDLVMDKLLKAKKPYKYVVNTVIAHRGSGGILVVSSASFGQHDGVLCQANETSGSIFCAVTL